jgi:O-antigen/teichoic acid export membrane protein
VRVVPGSVADGLSQEVSVWTLGVVAPVAAVGAFNRAWLLSRRLVELNYRVTEMLFPTLVQRHTAGESEGFDRALVDTLRVSALGLMLPAAAGGGAAAGIMNLFGPGFQRGASALAILLAVPAMSLLSQCQVHALLAVDRAFTTSKVSILRMVVTVVACIFLAQADGITGAAIAIVIGYMVDLAVRFHIGRSVLHERLTRLWPPRTMVATGIAYAAGFATSRVIDRGLGGIPGVLAALSAGVVVYLVVLVLLGGILPRDRQAIRGILDRLHDRAPRGVPLLRRFAQARESAR